MDSLENLFDDKLLTASEFRKGGSTRRSRSCSQVTQEVRKYILNIEELSNKIQK